MRLLRGLLFGFLLMVLVCWVAMFVPRGAKGQAYGPGAIDSLGLVKSSDGLTTWRLEEGRNGWQHVVQYWRVQMSGMSLMTPLEDYEARKFDLTTLPAHLRPDSVDDLTMMAWYREVGWPMRALTCSVHWRTQVRNSDILYDVVGGWQLPRDANFEPRALPYTPVWWGFVVNVFCGAVLYWLVGGMWLGLRRWRRVRGGLCLGCGYSLRGLDVGVGCPECGVGRELVDD